MTPGGDARAAAKNLSFPNGAIVIEDRSVLVKAEQMAGKLTAFDIADDGVDVPGAGSP